MERETKIRENVTENKSRVKYGRQIAGFNNKAGFKKNKKIRSRRRLLI